MSTGKNSRELTSEPNLNEKKLIPDFVWILALVLLAASASYFGFSKIQEYEETTYDSKSYTKAKDQYSFISRVNQACNNENYQGKSESCDAAIELIKNVAQIDDLAAQETVARATRGLLWIGWLQFAATAFTLSFVVWAVVQGHQMADKAGVAANAAIRTAEAAESAERAYVDIELVPTYLAGTDREKFKVVVQITNYGKTPAKNISYEVSPLYRNEKNKVYRCGKGGSVFSYCCSKKPIEILPNNTGEPLMIEVHTRDGGTSEFDTIGFCKNPRFSLLVKWSYKTIFDGEVIDRLPDEYIAVFKWTAFDESAKFDVTGGALSAVDGISSIHFERDKESEYQYAD